jgi:aminocarboxymuconate-semialdehyde decarboxylase
VIVPHNGSAIPVLTGRLDIGHRAYKDCQDNIPKPPREYIRDLYYDTVGFHVPALMCTYQTAGPDRMLLGTDYPHIIGDIVRCVQDIGRMEIPEDERKMILGGNAEKLLKIE